MKKKKRSIVLTITLLVLIILVSFLAFFKSKNQNQSNYRFAVYFAPTSTAVAYGNDTASLIEFDSNGKCTYHDAKAFPFTGLVNYKDNLIFQNPTGLTNLNKKTSSLDLVVSENTIGYNMGDVLLDKDIFYFLSNESFKDDYYSSKLILGNLDTQKIHQVKGFIHSSGNDNNDIYLLTSDMINKNSKQIQKLSINSIDDIETSSNTLQFDSEIESNSKIIIHDGYIYCFVIKNSTSSSSINLLKIQKDSLKLEKEFELIKYDKSKDDDLYYPISKSSIFYIDDKIYYPTVLGKVYSFDVKEENFKEEFSIKDYDVTSNSNLLCNYNNEKNELYFFYYDKKKYILDSYDLTGKLNYKININNLNIDNKLYPHSFISLKSKNN